MAETKLSMTPEFRRSAKLTMLSKERVRLFKLKISPIALLSFIKTLLSSKIDELTDDVQLVRDSQKFILVHITNLFTSF